MLTEELLREKYLIEKRSIQSIADEYNVSCGPIRLKMKQFGIESRPNGFPLAEVGKIYGRLEVLCRLEDRRPTDVRFLCKCLDCWDFYTVRSHNLVKGKVVSCWNCSRRKGYMSISGNFWNYIKRSAASRDIEFDILPKYAYELLIKQEYKCAISGLDISLGSQFRRKSKDKIKIERTASVDRIDSSKGYIEGNVWWVHKDINIIKLDFDIDYFIQLCHSISDYQRRIGGE